MTKHTPGPWTHYHRRLRPTFGPYVHEIHGPNEERIVIWGGFDGNDLPKSTNRYNARLIAAAPDLLEALQEFAVQHRCGCGHPACNDCWRDKLAAKAIAKATGGRP